MKIDFDKLTSDYDYNTQVKEALAKEIEHAQARLSKAKREAEQLVELNKVVSSMPVGLF